MYVARSVNAIDRWSDLTGPSDAVGSHTIAGCVISRRSSKAPLAGRVGVSTSCWSPKEQRKELKMCSFDSGGPLATPVCQSTFGRFRSPSMKTGVGVSLRSSRSEHSARMLPTRISVGPLSEK